MGLLVSDKVSLVLEKSPWAPTSALVEKIVKKIGDQCDGWLETKEETLIKNHLRLACIKVKGPQEIPCYVEVTDGGIMFSLPIWVEALLRYKMVNEYKLDYQDERDELEEGRQPVWLSERKENRVQKR